MWQLGNICIAQLNQTILEAKSGIPTIVHTPWFPNDKGCLEGCIGADGKIVRYTEKEFLQFAISAFLASAGDGSYFGFSNMQDPRDEEDLGGWADVSWDYFDIYDTLHPGKPLGDGIFDASGTRVTRSFENGNVMVDCATGEWKLEFTTRSPTRQPTPTSAPTTASPTTASPTTAFASNRLANDKLTYCRLPKSCTNGRANVYSYTERHHTNDCSIAVCNGNGRSALHSRVAMIANGNR